MKKVLIVVDMQKGFIKYDNYKLLSKNIDQYINNSNYDVVIMTKFVNKSGSMYEKKLDYKNLQSQESQQFSIHTPKNAIIFEKYGYGLENNDLNIVKNLSVDSVDICGLQTDACIYAISLQLWDNGIYPNILINYTATDPKKEKYAKQMLIHQFGKVDEKM